METKTESNVSSKTETTQRNLNIMINHKHFTVSLIEILDLILKTSNEVNLELLDLNSKQNVKTFKNHTRLRKSCKELKDGFTSDESDFDQGKIIKKVYKTLTQELDKLYPQPNSSLFSLTNCDGAIVTIIPGIDVSVVAEIMNDDDLKILWGYIYMLYISSVGMISEINDHDKTGKIWEVLPKMRERVTKLGLMKDGKSFNPFVGLKHETGNYDINTMYENVEKVTPTGPSMDDVMKMTGVDKFFDIGQLNNQLKNVKQEEIQEATRNITKLLGAENDQDINDVCTTLVEGIVQDLKSNPDGGIKSLYETAKSVTQNIGSKLDQSKMRKTAMQLSSFLQNGESNLRGMKDDKGNPIGDKIMKSLEIPLKFAQNFESGKTPDLAQYQTLMDQVNQTMTQMKKENEKNNFGKKI